MVYVIDPLLDPRWTEFINGHDSASVFHSKPWLEAIQRTYGYPPIVYTTTPPPLPLTNGIVLCEIKSWLTGRRMVSVPFSDHCEPLLDNSGAAATITRELKNKVDAGNWKYIELRPKSAFSALNGAAESPACYLHMLDLRPCLEDLFRGFHKDCVQRKIRRAEREKLVYETGHSESLLTSFYGMMLQTRRRHQLPPQPIEWFRNLVACMGDRLQIRVAFKNGTAVASILTIRHKQVLVYKYGCADAAFQTLGGTPFLFWKTIIEAKESGLTWMDFGRSDADNPGLIAFKDRWGAKRSDLIYIRWSRKPIRDVAGGRSSGVVKHMFARMPDPILRTAGRILYRHVG